MENSLYDDEIFDSALEEKFSEEYFYANPMNTKIYFNLSGEDNSEEIVGNAVVANLEEVNEKIPVYSYNSSMFQKYLQGKRVITGVIALRKVTVASFLSLLRRRKSSEDILYDIKKIENQISELEKITGDFNSQPIGLINMLKQKLAELEEKEKNIRSSNNTTGYDYDEFFLNNTRQILEKDNLLYYIEIAKNNNSHGGNKASIRLEFKNSLGAGPSTRIKDVLFIKKQTEINIDKTDIFEVYSFIGNPDLDLIDRKSNIINVSIDDAKRLPDYESV